MKRFRSAIISCALLLSGTMLAGAQTKAYQINENDVLQITVYGQPALTGPFPVDADGNIGYPVVGNIKVVGLTTSETSQTISKALAEHIPGLTVTAAIGQYAPVYVVGDVKIPGKYQYRPGMIVLELMAVGGGAGKTENDAAAAGVQLLAAQQEYSDLQLQIAALKAKRARLTAELNGTDYDFSFPQSPVDSKEERDLQNKIIDGEKTLFQVRLNNLKTEQKSLADQVANYDEEIKTLQESIKLRDTEVQLQSENVESNRSLVEKGLAARSNLRDMERTLSEIRREGLEAQSYLARARQNQLATQQRITSLEETRRATAATELQELELNISRMEKRGTSQLLTMAEIAKRTGTMSSAVLARRTSVTISRTVKGKFQEITADTSTDVLPGDIVRVELNMGQIAPPAGASQTRKQSQAETPKNNVKGG